MAVRPLVVGIVGPSGSGKSTLASGIARARERCVVCHEDPRFFRKACAASYADRDPGDEEPTHVDWAATLEHVRTVLSSDVDVVILEHFLLLAPGSTLAGLCDLVLYASVGADTTSRDLCRERRVARSTRPPDEVAALRRYYDNHVWPAFLRNTHAPALALGARCVVLDATQPPDVILTAALAEVDRVASVASTR